MARPMPATTPKTHHVTGRLLANPVCQRDWDNAHLTNRLVDAHADNPAFGYRLLPDEVNAAGRVASENWIQRLCRAPKLAPGTVRCRPARTGPDRVWLTDITEHPTA